MKNGVELVETIDLLLKEKNLTRKDFCETINIPASTIATWKTRNIFPTIDVLSLIANKLNVSLDWLINDSSDFENRENILGKYSRKSIRLRIYKALEKKYKKTDERFTANFLENETILRELHRYYFTGGYVSYDTLLNWSKGRCDVDVYVFNEWAVSLNSTLQYILTGSELLIPSEKEGYSKAFEKDLYDLALEFRNELYCLHNYSSDRLNNVRYLLNELMKLEHLEYVEKKKAEKKE